MTGMTAYMFDGAKPLFLRGLSLFHGWLPFFLVYLVARLGYDGRGLPAGFDIETSDRLGLQIVRTLMSAELDGSLEMRHADSGGTDVVVRVPIGRRAGRGPAHCVPD
jgi:hypothetical protein